MNECKPKEVGKTIVRGYVKQCWCNQCEMRPECTAITKQSMVKMHKSKEYQKRMSVNNLLCAILEAYFLRLFGRMWHKRKSQLICRWQTERIEWHLLQANHKELWPRENQPHFFLIKIKATATIYLYSNILWRYFDTENALTRTFFNSYAFLQLILFLF